MKLVIENDTIKRLAGNARLTKEFPFLKNRAGTTKSGCCGDTTADQQLNNIKQAIASLPIDRQLVFKTITGASFVKVTFRIAGRVQTIIF